MEEQQKEVKKGWKVFWIIFDIVFFCIYFLLFLYLIYENNTIFYYDGYYRTNRAMALVFLIYPMSVPFIAVYCVRVVFWYQSLKRNKWILLLVLTGVFCNPIIAMLIPAPKESRGYIGYTRGFHQRMKEELDVKIIRDWLGTLEDDVFSVDSGWNNSTDKFIPIEILDSIPLKRFNYRFFKTEDDLNCIKICTSSGGISRLCGIVIGPKEMPIPSTDKVYYDEEGMRIKLCIRLEDGAYVWHD